MFIPKEYLGLILGLILGWIAHKIVIWANSTVPPEAYGSPLPPPPKTDTSSWKPEPADSNYIPPPDR